MRPGTAAALALLALSGCFDGQDDAGSPSLVDERIGAYRGVRVGMSTADVRHVLGEPGGGAGFFPLGESFGEIGGAPAVRVWPPGSRQRPSVLRYEHAAFLVGERGVFALVVTEPGARTRRGVAIGDPLDDARRAYRLGCADAVAGEGFAGRPAPTFTSCRGTTGGRIRIWFGRDPIRSITLARVGAR